jgi:predicted nuclease with TOPRIM domain
MTPTDRKELKEAIKEAIEQHSGNVNSIFKIIDVKLDSIKSETSKTNGRVTQLEHEVSTLKNAELSHLVKCPNTEKIINLEKMEVGRKAVSSFTWKQVTLGGVIAGLILTLAQLLIK